MKYSPQYPTLFSVGDFIQYTEARLEGIQNLAIVVSVCDGKTLMFTQSVKRWKGKLYHANYEILRTPLHFSISKITDVEVGDKDPEILSNLRDAFTKHTAVTYPYVIARGPFSGRIISGEIDFIHVILDNRSEFSDKLSIALFVGNRDLLLTT